MSRVHVVCQGECLSSIAYRHGFSSYRTIYDHPENDALRRLRPDPALIFPGDRIVIPEKTPKTVQLATGRTHNIAVHRPRTKIRLAVTDEFGSMLANVDYVLRVGELELHGKSTSEGLIEQTVPAHAEWATVEMTAIGLTLRLRLGNLDPVEMMTGVQARLNSLGFGAGPIDGVLGRRTAKAIHRFQELNDIEPSGEMNERTRAALVKAYGC